MHVNNKMERNKNMKIIYGKRKIRGKVLFDVEHKFAKGIPLDDQAVMIIRQILKTYPDAGNFEWLRNDKTGQLCAGLFSETEQSNRRTIVRPIGY